MQINESEVPKYLKSKESNISKSNRKSKHKHQYEECLIQYKFKQYEDKIHTSLDSYCIICGKLGGQFSQDKSIVSDYTQVIYREDIGKCYRVISGKELYEKYHDKLPVFFIGDVLNKYVGLEDNNSQGE